ncbi:MAG: hypothetical protein NZ822_01295 [Patescibacteria group bacterium]|nr:hypothetical protein [Patescibacteria group bacterium]
MINNKIIKVSLIIITILIVFSLMALLFFYILRGRQNHVAVFLNNGMVYFGKLSTFPRLKLVNPVYFQIDQNGNPSLQKFNDAFWQPKGVIYLNKNSVAFIAPLKNTSPVINFINQQSFPPAFWGQPQAQPQPQQPLPSQQPPVQSQIPSQPQIIQENIVE